MFENWILLVAASLLTFLIGEFYGIKIVDTIKLFKTLLKVSTDIYF